uniref:Uncharacterized protein n=1 Tax=Chromera velia CCMP2878 TaxID=1169474 RepID=A0A0G4IEK1_9ALVE|eukprot:Cvel_13640.t1-p1 / transcript=Cvel_13640.t1 / gene=Cvel_13640 / organism=Chromera_velia_CCMP2878 / gene_product=hypothetical protein / transcript_product=hypothetical protein / location=Cvel_scaffold940:29050-38868(-) / protein_length=132 / sequence_SO=supercontig / SO=protein_coding / is_pseudo=false
MQNHFNVFSLQAAFGDGEGAAQAAETMEARIRERISMMEIHGFDWVEDTWEVNATTFATNLSGTQTKHDADPPPILTATQAALQNAQRATQKEKGIEPPHSIYKEESFLVETRKTGLLAVEVPAILRMGTCT